MGPIEVRNRFVQSATYEAMAMPTGEVTDSLLRRYRKLAKGGVGLVIPGYMFVHPYGKAQRLQTSIHDDAMVPGLKKLAEPAHEWGAKVIFQVAHAGCQTTAAYTGRRPMGPSGKRRDPIYLNKPSAMTESDIQTVVRSFGEAARRAAEAGADGVQIHRRTGIW